MDRKGYIICAVVGFLGLLSSGLGIAAEVTKITLSDVQNTCVYPRSPAFALGLSAGLILFIALIIMNVAAGCIFYKKKLRLSEAGNIKSYFCLIVSWVSFAVAIWRFWAGAALNNKHGAATLDGGYCDVEVVKPGIFARAAVLSLASVSFSILFYISLSSVKELEVQSEVNHQSTQGVAMGQPECVFRPEDTFRRQQFL